jgi:hypothetical protein
MTPEAQRIAIAEACGWTHFIKATWTTAPGLGRQFKEGDTLAIVPGRSMHEPLPDYLNDINAMHEAEKVLVQGNQIDGTVSYGNKLMRICGTHEACIRATAAQRAEAFLRTIGKRVEE